MNNNASTGVVVVCHKSITQFTRKSEVGFRKSKVSLTSLPDQVENGSERSKTMHLPESFVSRMQDLLKEEWRELLQAWQGEPYQGLRVNTLKISAPELKKRVPFNLEPIPWVEEGYYYPWGERPAKHPYYQAGLYYLQEPSAMAPVACLDIKPGEKVLDLCAAPGGKSTQIAAKLQGQGLLVTNDNNAERVKALVWNMEHWGATNAVVTNETPERLARVFSSYFDKILVDAPCSGEGMFRKDSRAIKSWENYSVENCAVLQKDILEVAAGMLKPGGRLLYSTCTFSPQENEGVIADFLGKHSEFKIVPLPLAHGWARGRPDWVNDAAGLVKEARRLWPHKVKGEGHFLALLEKDSTESKPLSPVHYGEEKNLESLYAFMEENLTHPLAGPFLLQGQYMYRIPQGLPVMQGLKVVRPGWFIGVLKNKRFEPSQALAMGLYKNDAQKTLSFSLEDEEVERYLKGETLLVDGEKGWTLVCLEEFPLGWGKQTGEYLKNYYPPGWRLLE
ncbi:MAG: NOL1/NOP2/sun family putative methylase [Peptococcaceae bacterium]|nr:NOL1/NOP2/sun family putative methylase [Peptococcaceae bacterium]